MEKTCHMEVRHTFEPVFDNNSKVLILGTMPSIKSRAENFYYMHPQNLFWKVMSNILETQFPLTVDYKKKMLLDNNIALWDVLKSCEIEGSSDSSIRKAAPNDLSEVLAKARIKAIFTNGTKATDLYKKHCSLPAGMRSIHLPSTSPANRKYYDFDKICTEWKQILSYL